MLPIEIFKHVEVIFIFYAFYYETIIIAQGILNRDFNVFSKSIMEVMIEDS
jgi:hypothetical protein